MSDALRIAKLQARTERLKTAKEFALSVLENPAFELVAGSLLIDYLVNHTDEGAFQEIIQVSGATALKTGLTVVCTAKALAGLAGSPAISGLVGKYLP